MEVLHSKSSYSEEDSQNLGHLLDVFGSVVSLKEIAAAYCQAGRDVDTAGEILCNHQGSTSSISSVSIGELEAAGSDGNLQGSKSCNLSSASNEEYSGAGSSDNLLGRSDADISSTAPKPRKNSVSLGTVSGIIGREYGRTRPSNKEPREASKPLKLDSRVLAPSDIWGEEVQSDGMGTSAPVQKDVEEFLFTMLGDAFLLDKSVIHEVLGLCGYDITKSLEKLLDMSVLTEKDEVASGTNVKTSKLEAQPSLQKNYLCKDTGESRTGTLTKKELESPNRGEKDNLVEQVMASLFTVPERKEQSPRKIIRPAERLARSHGYVVTEPLIERPREDWKIPKLKISTVDIDEIDDSYNGLRKAAQQYWITMKQYYKAATAAFTEGDRTRADTLMKEGQFFRTKAREANDKAAEKLIETSKEEDEMSLDLLDHGPKEAIRSLKCHLTSLSGIYSLCLKILVGNGDNDAKGAARKKRILELLERESIKWTEEANGQIIVIRMDKVDPKSLTFVKKETYS